MISPISDEATWQPLLQRLPAWHPGPRPMLIVSPHPDDETLGAGGLIASQRARGVSVTVIAVTDGENAYEGYTGLGAIREQEQEAAIARLGVAHDAVYRFRLPDSSVTAHVDELIDRLMALTTADTHLVAPWKGDFHPDHAACGLAAEAVAARTGAQPSSYFFWSWHLAAFETLAALPLAAFPLDADASAAKLAALECHASQLAWRDGKPILPPSLLGPAYRNVEVFLV